MAISRIMLAFDPLVRLLLVAILLASFLPVTGDGRAIARSVSDGGIFLLFLLNGLRLPRADVFAGMRNWSFLLPLSLWCFLGMGAAGWLLWRAGGQLLPEHIALGLLFLGILPSTVQSATAYSSLAGGNVAASVVAAALINVTGVFVTAPLLALLAGTAAVDLDLDGLQRIATILVLPFVLGHVLQNWLGDWVRERRSLIGWADKLCIATAVYVAFSGAVEQGLWTLVGPGLWAVLLGLVAVFLAVGFGGSWLLGGAIGLGRQERISFLFAGAQKSIAIGAPLAAVLFPPATAGLLLLPVLVYHLLQLVLSAPIARKLNPLPG